MCVNVSSNRSTCKGSRVGRALLRPGRARMLAKNIAGKAFEMTVYSTLSARRKADIGLNVDGTLTLRA